MTIERSSSGHVLLAVTALLMAGCADHGGMCDALCEAGFHLDPAACSCVPDDPPPPPLDALPRRGEWKPVSRDGAPSTRSGHTIVWTGKRYIVWGGAPSDRSAPALNDGAQYDPAADHWTAVTLTGAPAARANHQAVWTGKHMAVFGQDIDVFPTQPMEGALYDPDLDTWRPMSSSGAPTPRAYYDVVAVDGKVIVWGGWSQAGIGSQEWPDATGGIYDPDSDTWTPVNPTGAPKYDGGHTTLSAAGGFVAYGATSTFIGADPGHMIAARYDLAAGTWSMLGEQINQIGNYQAYGTSLLLNDSMIAVTVAKDGRTCQLVELDLIRKSWNTATLSTGNAGPNGCPLVTREAPLVAGGCLTAVESFNLVDLATHDIFKMADAPYGAIAENEIPSGIHIERWQGLASATDSNSIFVFGGSIQGQGAPPNCPVGAPCLPPEQLESAVFGALFTP